MQPHRMILALFAFVALAVPAAAQEPADSARVAELERQVEAVTRELESLRLGRDVVQADTSVLGFGPAASRIYRVDQGGPWAATAKSCTRTSRPSGRTGSARSAGTTPSRGACTS